MKGSDIQNIISMLLAHVYFLEACSVRGKADQKT